MKKADRFWHRVMVACCIVAIACVGVLLYILASWRKNEAALQAAANDPLLLEMTKEADYTADAPAEPVPVPVDFPYLQGINPDIYAWLVMPMSGQEYPVLQNSEDSRTYLRRDIYGEYAAGGSLFTEALHNTRSFDDPCTVIFGHNMLSGAMFGSLERCMQELNLNDASDEKNYLTVYTPGGIRKYRILCAGPYSDDSILFHHSFSRPGEADSFVDEMKNYPVDGFVCCSNRVPADDDSLLMLSTCYRLTTRNRYVVVAVLTEKYGV